MPFRFTLNTLGEAQIDRTLLRFADNIGDATPVWEVLADRFAKLETRQFKTEGAYGSGGWAALSPNYAAWKSHHYPGKPILQRTGALMRDLTQRPFGVEHITPGAMAVGTDLSYGKYHQAGGPHLPQRRPVELPDGERRYWVGLIQRFIITGKATRTY